MSDYQTKTTGKDPVLWDIAQKRVNFKKHILSYSGVNIFMWAVWYFTSNGHTDGTFPWPIWTTLGWGIGLAAHFAEAYLPENDVEREYEKLKNKQ